MEWSFDGLTIDVGGVLTVPRHDRLAAAFAEADLDVDEHRFVDAHYLAMHAVDDAGSEAETFGDYVPAFCHHVGFVGSRHDRAVAAIDPLFGPSGLWSQVIEESRTGLATLGEAGIPLVVLSNADGTVAAMLAEVGVCQVGDGAATRVEAVVDSGELGVAKPERAIFDVAASALDLPAERIVHVGDSVHYDVEGALAAGMQAAHFDPRRLCSRDDHAHVTALADLLGAS